MSTRLGPYELLQEVGYGGMGSVYLGRRVGLGGFHKWVAIKTIHPHLAKEAAFVTMFLDEARTAASMQHPNVTTVFDVGEADGTYYLAMEYLHGEHLGVFQGTGPIDPFLAAHAIARAAEGLHHAHEITDEQGIPRGLVHRDVSPHNVFLTYDGHVKVTDFGIARAEGRLAKTTETGRIRGKCAYMAPEQVQALPLDRRADLFALGVVLWELVTGERLYVAPTDAQVLLAILREEPRPPSILVPDCPPALEAIVMKCLARDPDDRFATGAELARALDAFVATASRPIGAAALAGLMQERFESTRVEKDRLLRGAAVPRGASSDVVLAETVAADALLASDEGRVEARGTADGASTSSTARGSATRPSLRAIAAGLVVLAVVGVAIGFAMGRPEPTLARLESEPGLGPGAGASGAGPSGEARLGEAIEPSAPSDAVRDMASDSASDVVSGNAEASARPASNTASAPSPSAPSPSAPSPSAPSPSAPSPSAPSARSSAMRSDRARGTSRGPSTPSSEPAVVEASRSAGSAADEASQAAPSSARATLSLLTEPWATVRIGGRDYGRTPLFARDVPAGRLVIELRARGEGDVVSRTVNASAGEAVSLRVTLPD
ncbi:MAG: protein kinase [Myxococcota bacterium]|jgi:serine/threonine-protein kinase|nr:protein kinase [Myxococcota bacterium]